MSREEIRDIVTDLKNLQIEQDTLISRLERLSKSATKETTTDATRELAVGDQVRIKNIGLFRETNGKIIKIGKRITILSKTELR
jgi:transcription antitermination factor NusG